jgi:hypothetical protein
LGTVEEEKNFKKKAKEKRMKRKIRFSKKEKRKIRN